jgi:hypothetical protein
MSRLGLVLALLLSVPMARAADAPPPPAEVLEKTYLYEMTRYLYRWYLDERDVQPVSGVTALVFRVRALTPELDAGDKSEFAEITIPLLRCQVLVKKPDYVIEETGTTVKGRGFRVYRVAREDAPETAPDGTVTVSAPMQDLWDYLFRTRGQVEFPDVTLVDRLRTALAAQMKEEAARHPVTGILTVYFAPLAPVSNDWWVYWENRKRLIRFSSDIDLTNPDVWEHERIGIQTWDAYHQMVVSTEEAPGSNEFLTRDQIGRALYNCLVLGRREELTPRPVSPNAEESAADRAISQ